MGLTSRSHPSYPCHYNETFALGEVSHGPRPESSEPSPKQPTYIVIADGETFVNAPAAEVTRGFLYQRPLGDPAPLPPEPMLVPIDNPNEFFCDCSAMEHRQPQTPV